MSSATASGRGLLLRGLGAGHRHRAVLAGIDLDAEPGTLTALLGANGVGKSTLLHTLAGLLRPLAGTVTLAGTDLTRLDARQRARRIAVVLTDRVEPGLLTARELVVLGRHPHTGAAGVLRAADHSAVDTALDAVGAAHLAGRRAAELSDGERQRLLVARALAQEPDLLLLDEPTAFLDAPARVAVTGLLRRVARERRIVVVASTHDVEIALRTADALWLVDRTGGVASGAPDALAAGGAIGKAFDADGLRFDPARRMFVVPDAGT
jgi:iron complex transport system ATP-binding protein